jgi:hypothetical protein
MSANLLAMNEHRQPSAECLLVGTASIAMVH